MGEADKILEHEIFVIFFLGSRFVIAENVSPVDAHFFHETAKLNTVNLLMISQNNIAREKNKVGLFCLNMLCKHGKGLIDKFIIIAKVKIGRYKNLERLIDNSAACVAFCDKC